MNSHQDFEARMQMKKQESHDKRVLTSGDVDSGTGQDILHPITPSLSTNDTQQIIANLMDFKVLLFYI